MIITLTGPNTFARQSALKALTKEFIETHSDMGLEKIDGEEADYNRIRESLESLPFLADKKLVVLRAPGANKQFVENTQKLIDNLPESTDLIIVEPKLDKRSVYYKLLKKSTDYREFNELDENTLSKWLEQAAAKTGAKMSQSVARHLIERVGLNQQRLSKELEKLRNYDDYITREVVDLLTEATPQSSVFDLLDAAFAGKRANVIKLYEQQRMLKVEPQAIIGLLAWQLHLLAVVKTAGERSDGEIASEAKLNPYVLRKSRNLGQKISLIRLKEIISELSDLDLMMKSSKVDADDALQAYLLKLSNQ